MQVKRKRKRTTVSPSVILLVASLLAVSYALYLTTNLIQSGESRRPIKRPRKEQVLLNPRQKAMVEVNKSTLTESYSSIANTPVSNSSQVAPLAVTLPHTSLSSIGMTDNQKSRILRVAEGCQRLQPISKITVHDMRSAAILNNMFVDDRRGYVYCRIGKVASTTWSRVLLIASGKVKKKSPNNIAQSRTYAILQSGRVLKSLSSFGQKGIERRLKSYFKFVFVRHPLDRMISAFYDRLKADHKLPKTIYTKRIIEKYRFANETYDSKDLRFEEFVRYLVDPETKKTGYNPHWRPQYDRCLPCHIQYDFIGHYETLQDDAQYVLKRIGAESRVTFPADDRDNKHRNNATVRLNTLLSTLPADHVHRLKTDVYGNDFAVFGYD